MSSIVWVFTNLASAIDLPTPSMPFMASRFWRVKTLLPDGDWPSWSPPQPQTSHSTLHWLRCVYKSLRSNHHHPKCVDLSKVDDSTISGPDIVAGFLTTCHIWDYHAVCCMVIRPFSTDIFNRDIRTIDHFMNSWQISEILSSKTNISSELSRRSMHLGLVPS